MNNRRYKYIRANSNEEASINKPSIIEWCLIISICLMPFTALKLIGPIGLSEFLLLAVFFQLLWDKGMHLELGRTFVSEYYLCFFIACCTGTLWNVTRTIVFKKQFSGTINGIVFDCLSYLFVLMSLFVIEMYNDSRYYVLGEQGLLKYIVILNCITMTLLFLISRNNTTIYGYQLLYADKLFAPLAANLHHTAMYLLPLAFATIYIAEQQDSLIKELFYCAYAAFFMYLAMATGSTKASIGVWSGLIICIIYRITTYRGVFNNKTRVFMAVILFIFVLYTAFNYESVKQFAINFFVENDMGSSRQDLWNLTIDKWLDSPIIGYGFGSHILYVQTHYSDAHNTILTALIQAGVVGGFIFAVLWMRILKETFDNGYLLACNIAISSYMLGGDILRRLPCWTFIILSIYIVSNAQLVPNKSSLQGYE